ncbi:DUF2062 domain-containing protein [Sphingomonas sp. AOB5]|uniref:DUF2062 domain-containing protein n=1 Tax=Sphingomonas sp. AOB5 TaxID=3034017 RepID=UPI0023F8D735|nr:DUF2062 domain-containing protein [Sphingomonas sp. AOB5]MDF7774472.1 DUF2062 domain-containing protein [Sphingomonas sp. AOB5]
MPTREELEKSRILRPIAHRVLHSSLWRFTRRSVPRGVALGLLVGIFLLIPGLQIAGAALLALPFRANVPIAAAMTFLSNPATTPFILYLSIWWGNSLLGRHADLAGLMTLIDSGAPISAWASWFFSDAAPSLLLGLTIISVLCAVVGYMLSIFGWRWWIARKWKKRQDLRNERALNAQFLE